MIRGSGRREIEAELVLVVTSVTHSDFSGWEAGDMRFRLVFESSPSGLIIVDAPGRMVMVNPAAGRMFGYEQPELIGAPVELLVPERFRARHPQLRER